MKKYLLIIPFLMLAFISKAQYSTSIFVVPDTTTHFGKNMAIHSIVYAYNNNKMYSLNQTATASQGLDDVILKTQANSGGGSADSSIFATQSWVQSQGYLSIGDTATILATPFYVNSQGFITVETDPTWSNEKSLYVVLADTITRIATPTQVLSYGFLTAEVDGDVTNEIQDTTEIAGLQAFVESYSINSFTETDPLFVADSTNIYSAIRTKTNLSDSVTSYVTPTSLLTYSYATTSQVGAKADTSSVPLLATPNTFTKANEFTSTIKLTNASTITTADSMLVIDGGIIKKEVIVDLTNSTIPSATIDTLVVNENTSVFGGETLYVSKQSMIDDSSIILPTATCGYGDIVVGDGTTWVRFVWTTAGVVTLLDNSADVDDADTDTFFCIFDSGTTITIKNRLGSTKNVRFNLHYSTN